MGGYGQRRAVALLSVWVLVGRIGRSASAVKARGRVVAFDAGRACRTGVAVRWPRAPICWPDKAVIRPWVWRVGSEGVC